MEYSKFLRDVHVIAETLEVAKLVDIYELRDEDISDASPRRFYFVILESLRIAQPKPFHTPLIDSGIACDPEAGLFFEENFNQQQLAKGSAENQHLVDFINDIERLRTFYQVIWMRFNKGISDIRATTWAADEPNMPDTLSEAMERSSNSMQQIWRAVVPYIDKTIPSQKEIEVAYQKKFRSVVEKEFPAR